MNFFDSLKMAPSVLLRRPALILSLWMWAIIAAPAQEAEEATEVDVAPPPRVALTSSTSETIIAGSQWAPYTQELEIEAGSVFDLSAMADAPAGKHGYVIATPAGHLEYEQAPGQPVRFWGVNTLFGVNLLDHQQADQLAERLMRSGYNTLRIHHFDRVIGKAGGFSYEFDPEKLDRLDYYFAALKKRGIYIVIDLYSNRRFSKAEIPDLGEDVHGNFKRLVPLSSTAMDSWKKFAENLLTHRNPYTGLTWAADPALLSICPINEDTFFGPWEKKPKKLAALYDAAFEKWLAQHPQFATSDRNKAFNEFLVEVQIQADSQMRSYLRSLGVKALITGSNFRDTQAQIYMREGYDQVEDHNYWNHPTFSGSKWNFPVKINQNSALSSSVWLPRETMTSRIFGKPFFVTEFNYVWPNQCRSEGGVIMAAYASLQDWDALYNFDYVAHPELVFGPGVAPRAGSVFSLATDPIGLLSDRASALIFRRRDLNAAPHAACYVVTKEQAFAGKKAEPPSFPAGFSWFGMVTRIGSLSAESNSLATVAKNTGITAFVSSKEVPGVKPFSLLGSATGKQLAAAGTFPEGSFNPKARQYDSETGQIHLNMAQGNLSTVAPRSECFVTPPGQSLKGKQVSIQNQETFASVYVLSVDGLALEKSKRLVVLHLTDSVNTETRFSDSKHTLMQAIGKLPLLVRAGTTQVSIRLPDGKSWEAWALSSSGRRLFSVPLTATAEGISLTAQTVRKEGTTLAYELAKKAD